MSEKRDDLDGLDPLSPGEVQILQNVLEPVDFDEFIGEMASRGLIMPGVVPTTFQRLLMALLTPFRFIGRALGSVTWHLWGKRRHQRNVEREIARWQEMAGNAVEPGYPLGPERAGYIRIGHNLEQKLHDKIIKSNIVREDLPKPDADDSGLN